LKELIFYLATERCYDVRDSERKKVIRQNGLYYEIDLKDLCIKSFKVNCKGDFVVNLS